MTTPKQPFDVSNTSTPDTTPDTKAMSDDDGAKRTAEQNAQARLVLIQLLWVAVLLMVAAMVWLAFKQKQTALYVDERLAVIETFTTRMNNMDDRLFAMTPSEQRPVQTLDAQNDTQLVAVQLASADRLYQDGDYKASYEILKLLQWQLGGERLVLALPLKSALKVAIDEDLNRIAAMQNQIDPWQADVIQMREVQSYLRGLPQETTINQRQLAYHDATMLLSLAIGAGVMRERETVVVYLGECIQKLQQLQRLSPGPAKPDSRSGVLSSTSPNADQNKQESTSLPNDGTVDSLEAAIFALNSILANPPKLTPLKSLEIAKSV